MVCAVPSSAVTETATEAASSKSSATPSRSLSVPSTISKRASSVVKTTARPSGLVAESVPTTAPGAFSDTGSPVRLGASGASATSVTVTVSVVAVEAPPASVAVTATSTVAPASKSSATPSRSLSWPSTTSKGESAGTEKVIASPSGSVADSAPTTAPAAFSATSLASSVAAEGAPFGASTRVKVNLSVRRSSALARPESVSTVPSATKTGASNTTVLMLPRCPAAPVGAPGKSWVPAPSKAAASASTVSPILSE